MSCFVVFLLIFNSERMFCWIQHVFVSSWLVFPVPVPFHHMSSNMDRALSGTGRLNTGVPGCIPGGSGGGAPRHALAYNRRNGGLEDCVLRVWHTGGSGGFLFVLLVVDMVDVVVLVVVLLLLYSINILIKHFPLYVFYRCCYPCYFWCAYHCYCYYGIVLVPVVLFLEFFIALLPVIVSYLFCFIFI